MESEIKNHYKKYIALAEQRYGKLPKHCYETEFKREMNPDSFNASGADCKKNVCYIKPEAPDLEWVVFHEMEHIRTANERTSRSLPESLSTVLRKINIWGILWMKR